MPNPKKRHSKSRQGNRRAKWFLMEKLLCLNICPQCSQPKLPHRVCLNCGFYNGELILPKKEKTKPKTEE